ncbi:MAG: methyl-accepting chemotaxis protein [Ruminiclostridium sp.]|nr:methyl-accepting chemotaxis protein [Ruminiclostridium sp.]
MKRLSIKIMLLSIIICFVSSAFFLTSNFFALNNLRTETKELYHGSLSEELDTRIKSVAKIALFSLKTFQFQQSVWKFTLEEAKTEAVKHIRNTSGYSGDTGSYFILSMDGTMVYFPTDVSLEGKNVLDMEYDGRKVFKEIIETATSNTSGAFLDFSLKKAGESEFSPVSSFVISDNQYQWVIGATQFLGSVETSVDTFNILTTGISDRLMITTVTFSAVFLILVILISIYFGTRITRPIQKLTQLSSKLSEGDLTFEVQVKSKDETRVLADAFNKSIISLRELLNEAIHVSNQVNEKSLLINRSMLQILAGTSQINDSVQDLAEGITKQATSADEINNKATDTKLSIEKINQDMIESGQLTQHARELAEKGTDTLAFQKEKMDVNVEASRNTETSIQHLANTVSEITGIIDVINNISKQTKLLSLNASIEAARAGELGKGFAVVADEIRKLAEETVNSTKMIISIIDEVKQAVNKAVDSVRTSQDAVSDQGASLAVTAGVFQEILASIGKAYQNAMNVQEATQLLENGFSIISSEISDVAGVSEESAAVVEEVSATTQEQSASIEEIVRSFEQLGKLSGELNDNLKKFKTN